MSVEEARDRYEDAVDAAKTYEDEGEINAAFFALVAEVQLEELERLRPMIESALVMPWHAEWYRERVEELREKLGLLLV